jgi:regulator of protease activity HflC (stomatin/prohibitin superfamily)
MDLDLTKTSLWISIFIGALVVAAASAGFQQYSAEEGTKLNVKGIIRDAILGGIFVAMTWTLIPDSMTVLTDNVTHTISNTVNSSTEKMSDVDLQIGPPKF